MTNRVNILGVEVDVISAPELMVALRQGIGRGDRQQVVTVYSEMLMRARRDAAYRHLINHATFRPADGIGVVWAAHYLGRPLRGPLKGFRAHIQALRTLLLLLVWPRRVKTVLPEAIPGADLAIDLAAMCEEFGYRLYLLGAAEGVASRAARKLQDRFPGLEVAAAVGSPSPSQDARVRKQLVDAGAQVILVAYGAPAQEQWIARNLGRLPKPVLAVGVGGTFDYLVGARSMTGGKRKAKAPPRFVRRRGLESFWRLVTQPDRFGRIMTALPLFVLAVINEKRNRIRAHRRQKR
jgi:N-acetylglucosaminyldiphosphoundecaprenol N-acetyl-beta-D-mannosaminyltransferase